MKNHRPFDLLNTPLEGMSLIEASAGTGKTFAISHLYLRLLLEKALEPGSILVVTFTEAATKELRDRIRKNLIEAGAAAEDSTRCTDTTVSAILKKYCSTHTREQAQSLLRKAIIGFDEAAIFTIHGFCKRMLRDNSFESSLLFDTELVTDQDDIIQELADDYWRKTFSDSDALLGALAKKSGLDTSELVRLAQEIIKKPFLKIIPHTVPSSPEKILRLFSDLRTQWRESSNVIKELLLTDTGLKREKDRYRHDNLEGLFEDINACFFVAPSAQTLKSLRLFAAGELGKHMKKNSAPPRHTFFDRCEEFAREERRFVMQVKLDYFAYVKTELYKRKRARNIQSFDDLLLDMLAALSSDAGAALGDAVRSRFRAALIDEFQDTDPVQYKIFDTLFNVKSHSLFLIGDPKQSIYAFRGADIFSYIEAAAKTKKERTYTLATNWRSETGVVEAINYFFSRAQNPFVLGDSIGYYTVNGAPESVGNKNRLMIDDLNDAGLHLWCLKNTRDKSLSREAALEPAGNAVVCEIARILNCAARGMAFIGGRPVRPSDFAILVMRNEDALLFVEPLTRLNIPVVLAKTGTIFQTPEAEDVERLLRAVAAPGKARLLHAGLATSLIGFDAEQIRYLIEDEQGLKEYERHMENFILYNELWNTKSFIRMFRKFLCDYRVRQRLLQFPDGERRLTNVLHLGELLHTAAREHKLGANGLLSFLSEQRTAGTDREEHELRLERDEEAVQILTVFKSKGLQYPVVFCPFMWQRGAAGKGDDLVFHRKGSVFLDIGSPDRDTVSRPLADREQLSELIRLLYVGLTRAQNRCYLTCGKIGQPAASSLDYIFTGGAADTAGIVAGLVNKIKNLSEDQVCDAIKEYISGAPETVRIVPPDPEKPQPYPSDRDNNVKVDSCLTMSSPDRINRDWGIASYSMLSAGERHTAGYDEKSLKRDEPRENDPPRSGDSAAPGFSAFPRGPVAGSCIHSIFEKLDFTLRDETGIKSLVSQSLTNYGLCRAAGQDLLVAATYDMITNVLNSPLLPDNRTFTLRTLGRNQRISELGFYYPLKKITSDRIKSVFQNHGGFYGGAVPERIGGLQFRPVEGFMQGFIDLVFSVSGKYYLLDWKTNHLGNTCDDYAQEQLQRAMEYALYNLQYAIYTVALHKYLSRRIPGYTYENNFGGVLYLFVRGIAPDHPGCGIFYDRPSKDFVHELCLLTE